VILTGPEKEGLKLPTEKEVLDALKVDTDAITPYKDTEIAASLLRNEVKAGTVVKREKDTKMGTTTLTLSSGVKVTYKKTDFKNDEILMSALSFGGSNLYSNGELRQTQFANGALTEAGFSGLKVNDINKFMNGKIANPYIASTSEGFNGSATLKDRVSVPNDACLFYRLKYG
jgi:zinc protease